MRLLWMTDIHLDCVDDVLGVLENLNYENSGADALIISGDISVAPTIIHHLRDIEGSFEKPFFFVLGNHDYYFSDVMTVRRNVVNLCRNMSFAKYLHAIPYIKLDNRTALIGADGWYDGRNGDVAASEVVMNDWLKIQDFSPAVQNNLLNKQINKRGIIQIAQALCKESVTHVINGIKAAAESSDKIIIVTHVPPFAESYSSDKYRDIDYSHLLPWYTSQTMAEAINAAASFFKNKQFLVLSGHTHSSFEGRLSSNLEVRVGKSAYGTPQISGYIDT